MSDNDSLGLLKVRRWWRWWDRSTVDAESDTTGTASETVTGETNIISGDDTVNSDSDVGSGGTVKYGSDFNIASSDRDT